mmetsp:Transcript_127831/g.238995  ORF Transcript_127831/g.238995 Transcript_127831/m.238995 type:complete len:432 (-) Transcript_127831:65-1360(-)
MTTAISRSATPAVVSQRMCDLLQTFPSAAMGGVQWRTLVRKYEERYTSRLDVAALGDSSVAAASMLLFDVLRLVDREDTDNPVVAIEDVVALTPRPGSLASWPSMYKVLCEAALHHGTLEVSDTPNAEAPGEVSRAILLSQLKPLLQRLWHSSFDESGLSYLTAEGTSVKLKKMKHLVQAVLRWREERAAWVAEACIRPTEIDELLKPRLELVPSKKHNDLVLRCTLVNDTVTPTPIVSCIFQNPQQIPSTEVSTDADSEFSSASTGLEEELAKLRAENAMLRNKNEFLEHHAKDAVLRCELFDTPQKPQPVHMPEVFDDPFEPPPQVDRCWSFDSPAGSTTFGSSSGCATPMSLSSSLAPTSGSATPQQVVSGTPTNFSTAAAGPMCAFMPVWFSTAMGDRVQIPCGVVQQAKAIFERGDAGVPPFFVRQ